MRGRLMMGIWEQDDDQLQSFIIWSSAHASDLLLYKLQLLTQIKNQLKAFKKVD